MPHDWITTGGMRGTFLIGQGEHIGQVSRGLLKVTGSAVPQKFEKGYAELTDTWNRHEVEWIVGMEVYWSGRRRWGSI